MDYRASHRYAKTTARKARLVVDLIRGLPVNRALTVLDRSPRRAAVLVGKVVRSAVANAEQDTDVDPNQLHVAVARVDEGPLLGGFLRWRPGPRGRAMPIHKRTAHIHITLAPQMPSAAPATAAPSAKPGKAGKGGKAAASKGKAPGGAGAKAKGKGKAAGKAGGKSAKKKDD
jgi:large subunit ribosomal protein L22